MEGVKETVNIPGLLMKPEEEEEEQEEVAAAGT